MYHLFLSEPLDRLVGTWLYQRTRQGADGLLVIAVDGKVLRGSWTNANDKVTLFSAMIHDEAVTVAQIRVPDGTNETTQVKELLEGSRWGSWRFRVRRPVR